MWKWTRSDNIQLLILDGDTLEEEFLTYPYSKDDKVIKTVVVTKSEKLTGHKNSIKFFGTKIHINMSQINLKLH